MLFIFKIKETQYENKVGWWYCENNVSSRILLDSRRTDACHNASIEKILRQLGIQHRPNLTHLIFLCSLLKKIDIFVFWSCKTSIKL